MTAAPGAILLIGNGAVVLGLEALRRFRRLPVVMRASFAQACGGVPTCDLGATSRLVGPIDFAQFTELAEHVERCGGQLNSVSG